MRLPSGNKTISLPLRLRAIRVLGSLVLRRDATISTPESIAGELATTSPRRFWYLLVLISLALVLLFSREFGTIRSLADLLMFAGSAILRIANYLGFVVLAFSLVTIAVKVYMSIRFHGWSVLSRAVTTAGVYRFALANTESALTLGLVSAAVCLLVSLGFFVGMKHVAGLVAFILAPSIAYAMEFLYPPVILFLAASTPETIRLLASLRMTIADWRVAALLDVTRADEALLREFMSLDNFRTGGDRWLEVVGALRPIVRLTVLSADVRTPNLEQEVVHLRQSSSSIRTLIVGEPGNGYALIAEAVRSGSLVGDEIVLVTSHAALNMAVRSVVWNDLYRLPLLPLVKSITVRELVEPGGSERHEQVSGC